MPVSVLIVEKDPLNRESMVYMLESMRHIAAGVESASRAYEVLARVSVDVLLLGVGLDDRDGVRVAGVAKGYQPLLKVIVASGGLHADYQDSIVDVFLRKPFGLSDIGAAFRQLGM